MKYFIFQILICAFFVLAKPAYATDSYRLGIDDMISLTVYGEKDLSNQYKIGSNGGISIPLIGEVLLKDHTTAEAEQIITQKLSDGYLVDPSVSIAVVQQRPFYILGEVSKPGSYPCANNLNVLNAVAMAGGFTYRANRDDVEITRAGAPANQSVQTEIQPGDIILVKERFF